MVASIMCIAAGMTRNVSNTLCIVSPWPPDGIDRHIADQLRARYPKPCETRNACIDKEFPQTYL
jgi:hypothetical protein